MLEDRPAKLQGLKLVELALVQQYTKVLQQRGGLSWLSWYALEATDGVWGSQDTLRKKRKRSVQFSCYFRELLIDSVLIDYLWCIGSDLGSLRVVASSKQVVELACKQLFSASEVVADS